MGLARALYAAGVACASLAGFFCPAPYVGFVPLAAGLIWAAYDLTEVREQPHGKPPDRPPR